jgi:hypothetical protein
LKNKIWLSTKLPKAKKAIGSKRVFRILKKNANNDINKYEACLVVKRFAQTKRIDYFKTFVLVDNFAFIKTLLALIAISNFEIH